MLSDTRSCDRVCIYVIVYAFVPSSVYLCYRNAFVRSLTCLCAVRVRVRILVFVRLRVRVDVRVLVCVRVHSGTKISCEAHADTGGYKETHVKLKFNYRDAFHTYVS